MRDINVQDWMDMIKAIRLLTEAINRNTNFTGGGK